MLEYETRCLNVQLLIFLALHYKHKKKNPWKHNVGGANVFQKEKETEKETEKEMEMEMFR